MTQPNYSACPYKIKARERNIKEYRRITKQDTIPEGRGYWTLCNKQPPAGDDEKSEIIQLIDAGLLTKKQFHGVDRDEEIINQNRIWHPDANWYTGEWLDVIESKEFNPAMIYLDMTSFADHWVATELVTRTMMICPSNTLLAANVMLNDPRSRRKFHSQQLLENISREIPERVLRKWLPDINEHRIEVPNYEYSATGKTQLETLFLYKK